MRGSWTKPFGDTNINAEPENSPAISYLTRYNGERKKVRVLWKEDAGDLLVAHEAALSAISSMVDRVADIKFEEQPKNVEGRMSLTAQFIQGIDICETAISEGLYSQAAALLKQEMETIEAVNDYETGQRRDKKTPRLNLLSGFGRIYGEFNNYAHVSVEDIHKSIVHFVKEDISGPSVLPQYQQHIAEYFYGYHVLFIIYCASQMMKILREVYELELTVEELEWLAVALKVLKDKDFIKTMNGDNDCKDGS